VRPTSCGHLLLQRRARKSTQLRAGSRPRRKQRPGTQRRKKDRYREPTGNLKLFRRARLQLEAESADIRSVEVLRRADGTLELQLMKSSMHGAGLGGKPSPPDFYCRTPCSFQLPGMMFSPGKLYHHVVNQIKSKTRLYSAVCHNKVRGAVWN